MSTAWKKLIASALTSLRFWEVMTLRFSRYCFPADNSAMGVAEMSFCTSTVNIKFVRVSWTAILPTASALLLTVARRFSSARKFQPLSTFREADKKFSP